MRLLNPTNCGIQRISQNNPSEAFGVYTGNTMSFCPSHSPYTPFQGQRLCSIHIWGTPAISCVAQGVRYNRWPWVFLNWSRKGGQLGGSALPGHLDMGSGQPQCTFPLCHTSFRFWILWTQVQILTMLLLTLRSGPCSHWSPNLSSSSEKGWGDPQVKTVWQESDPTHSRYSGDGTQPVRLLLPLSLLPFLSSVWEMSPRKREELF